MNQDSKSIPQKNYQSKLQSGWFKSPNYIFDLPISPNSKLILLNFCRRANKPGCSFPSIETISKDTGIKSHTSIRKYIHELIKNGHITKLQQGKEGVSNRYQLSKTIVDIVRRDSKETTNLTPSNNDYPAIYNTDLPPPYSDHPPSKFDRVPRQNMTPKEYSVKENTNKENTCVENEKNVFDSKTQNYKFSVRENEDSEIPNPSQDLDFSKRPAPARKNVNPPVPPPSSNEPSPRARLTREAADLLIRRAQGEDVDLSDIHAQFAELKTPRQ